MTTRASNDKESVLRLKNFDFLLGFFVILAMDEHFTYYLNWWYVEFFKEFPALKTIYQSHYSSIGKNLTTDNFNTMIGIIFIPWVSQIYLALTTFKLAAKSKGALKSGLRDRLKVLALIALVFIIENFLVAPNFGEAISIYPIVMWMTVLAILTTVFALWDYKGIIFVLIIGLIIPFYFLPDVSTYFQHWMAINVHPEFEYDARLEYFLASGCIGFLLGYCYFNFYEKIEKIFLMTIGLGILFVLFYFKSNSRFDINPSSSLDNEHQLAQSVGGLLYIWGMILIVLSAFALLEKKKIHIKIPIINWVGENSLTVFGLHRIVFIRIIIPISMFIMAMMGKSLGAGTIEIFTYILLTIGFAYMVSRLKLYRVIFPSKFKE